MLISPRIARSITPADSDSQIFLKSVFPLFSHQHPNLSYCLSILFIPSLASIKWPFQNVPSFILSSAPNTQNFHSPLENDPDSSFVPWGSPCLLLAGAFCNTELPLIFWDCPTRPLALTNLHPASGPGFMVFFCWEHFFQPRVSHPFLLGATLTGPYTLEQLPCLLVAWAVGPFPCMIVL